MWMRIPCREKEEMSRLRDAGRRRKTMLVGELLPDVLEAIEKQAGGKLPAIAARWQDTVGEEVARHTTPTFLRSANLTVEVDNAVWMAELSRFHSKRIVDAVNVSFEKEVIRSITFRPKRGK
jgi:predicted nucleic acid-binding Zn ribbon protein